MIDKHPDQALREVIPTRADIPTMFHPAHDLLMVVPIGDIKKVGTIILPDTARIVLNEGHIVEKGPRCGDQFNIGDCVTWDANSEYRMEIDGVKFVLVREGVINMMIPRTELDKANSQLLTTTLTEGEYVDLCPACGVDMNKHNHAQGCPKAEDEV